MRVGDRELRGAYVDVLGCVAFLRTLRDRGLDDALEVYAGGLRAAQDPLTQEAGRQLQSALAQMRSARSEWDRIRATGSDVGTSEPDVRGGGAVSGDAARGPGRKVREVAAELRVSESYVTRLCRDGTRLRGHLVGGVWFIDAASVEKYQASRRRVA